MVKHKRIFSFFVCFLLLFQFFIPGKVAKAATTPTITYSVANNTILVGDTFDILVNISNVSNLYAASLDFKYDPTMLEIVDVANGSLMSNFYFSTPINDSTKGDLSIFTTPLGGSVQPIQGSGSLFKITVKALKTGSMNLNTIATNSPLNLLDANVRVKLSDNNGSPINYSSQVTSIDINNILLNKIEETDGKLVYNGTWYNDPHPYLSSGNEKYTSNGSLSFSFNGTGFRLITCVGPDRGIAKVTIDGASYNVDMYAPSYKFKQIIFEKLNLSSGNHTVKIEGTNTKNTLASKTNIYVDAIHIAGNIIESIPVNSFEESNSNILYSGTWSNDSHPNLSGGNEKFTSNGSASFTFTGTGIRLIALPGPDRGIAKVTIDGVSYNVDMYSTSYNWKAVVFEKNNLAAGNHTFKIEATGTKNAAATKTNIYIDALAITGGSITQSVSFARTEETNSNILYSGTWSNDPHPNLSGGSEKFTSNGSASFNFTGTAIRIIALPGPDRGIAKVTIDGVAYNVDMYSPSYNWKSVVFEKNDLAAGNHTFKLESTGTKSAAATKTNVYIDAIDLAGGSITPSTAISFDRTEETNSNIIYSGTWSNDPHPNLSGGSEKFTSNGSASFNFTGTAIRLIALPGPDRGIAKITIDGVAYNVDMYSPSYNWKSVVFEKNDLVAGNHTFKLESTGTKSAAATKTNVYIDAIDLAGGSITPSTSVTYARTEETNSNILYSGTWSNDPHPNLSGGSEKFTSNGSASFNFTGTAIRLIALPGPDRGIAKITIDGVSYNVDMYSPSYNWKSVVFEKNDLAAGNHTFKLESTGTKSAAATKTNVYIDAIDLAGGSITPSTAISFDRTEETNSNIIYSGTWSNDPHPNLSGGSEKFTSNGSASFNFTGTAIRLIALPGPDRGIAKITIDGVAYNVDMYSPSYNWKSVVFEKNDLAAGNHTFKIESTGTKSAAATKTNVYIDAIDIAGGSITPSVSFNRYEENNSKISYSGTWSNDPHPSLSGGNEKFTSNGSASFTFTGTGIKLVALPGPDRGIAKITIDGVAYTVDMYSTSYKFNSILFAKTDLSSGSHTVKIEATGTKNAAATKTNIYIDAVEIAGSM